MSIDDFLDAAAPCAFVFLTTFLLTSMIVQCKKEQEQASSALARAEQTACPPKVDGRALDTAHVSEADGRVTLTCTYRPGRWQWIRELGVRKGVQS